MHALFAFSTYLLVHLYVSCLFRLFKDLHYAKLKREPANEERYNCELARTVIKEYFYSETLSPELSLIHI